MPDLNSGARDLRFYMVKVQKYTIFEKKRHVLCCFLRIAPVKDQCLGHNFSPRASFLMKLAESESYLTDLEF